MIREHFHGVAVIVAIVLIFVLVTLFRAIRIIPQARAGVVERQGRYHKTLLPGLSLLVPFVDRLRPLIDMREQVVSFPPQPVITEDNLVVSIDTVVYFQVTDARAATYEIANYLGAVEQLTTTTLRNVVGQHTLDECLAETDRINEDIRVILDRTTTEWGVDVTLVELKDIQLPETMKRAMARQAEAEREKRAKIINAEGEHLAAARLGAASDIMMEHPLALQLRNLQTLLELGVDKNTTVVFPSPLMSTIEELGTFLARERTAAARHEPEADSVPAPREPQRPSLATARHVD